MMNQPRRKPRRGAMRGGQQANRKRAPRRERGERPHRAPENAHAPATDWDNVAEWYDALVGTEGSEYQRDLIVPGVLRLLKPSGGERILDVGCGQGILCRVLHDAGAVMTGVDASESLVRLARSRSDRSIKYLVGDARHLQAIPGLAPGSFDAAICVLAIQNIHPLQPVFDGVAGALRMGGRLVLVMMHPCFRAPRSAQWGWDDQQGVQYRRIDQYLLPRKHPIVTHPGKDPGRYTWTFHRPLQSYVKSISRAGMVIDWLEEWASHKVSEPGPRAKAENRARNEIPMFLAIRARRVSGVQVTDAEELERDAG